MAKKKGDFPNKENRESISSGDLFQANRFIEYILTNSLHEKEDDRSILMLEALNIATIVSYSRPFKTNRNSKQNPADKVISEEYLECLTTEEKTLHKKIIDTRDQEIAHSDSDAHELKNYGDFSISRNTSIPLKKDEFFNLKRIIDKLLSKITPTIEIKF